MASSCLQDPSFQSEARLSRARSCHIDLAGLTNTLKLLNFIGDLPSFLCQGCDVLLEVLDPVHIGFLVLRDKSQGSRGTPARAFVSASSFPCPPTAD